DGRHAGPDLLAVHQHRARAALGQPAAEARPAQVQLVVQDVQQRRVQARGHLVHETVHLDLQLARHSTLPLALEVTTAQRAPRMQRGSLRSHPSLSYATTLSQQRAACLPRVSLFRRRLPASSSSQRTTPDFKTSPQTVTMKKYVREELVRESTSLALQDQTLKLIILPARVHCMSS